MLRTEHNALQNAGEGIAVADLDAILEYANPAMGRMWQCEQAEDLAGVRVRDLFQMKEAVEVMIGTVLREPQAWTGELTATSRGGAEFEVQVAAARNRNSDGEVVGMVLSFIDISDRKRAEEVSKKAEKQQVMLESLGAACHHLGQPATVVLGNLELLRTRLANAEPDVVELLDSSVRSMDDLGRVLHRLNQVNEYRTTCYIGDSQGQGDGSRILEI